MSTSASAPRWFTPAPILLFTFFVLLGGWAERAAAQTCVQEPLATGSMPLASDSLKDKHKKPKRRVPKDSAMVQTTAAGCVADATAPTVSIVPGTSSHTTGSVDVSVTWRDNVGLDRYAYWISLNGVDVTSRFSYGGTATAATSTGTVMLQPGQNTLVAEIWDQAGNYGSATVTYTYSPPPPVPTRPVTTPAPLPTMTSGATPTLQDVVRGIYRQVLEREATTDEINVWFNLLVNQGWTVKRAVREVVMAPEHQERFGVSSGRSGREAAALLYRHLFAREAEPGELDYWGPVVQNGGWLTLANALLADPGYTQWFGDHAVPGRPVSLWHAGRAELVLEPRSGYADVERDLCLTVAVGGGAYECGDLRLAHALPAVRTLNKVRQPVLLYNSDQAYPRPIIGARVLLPGGTATLTGVTAVLRVGPRPDQLVERQTRHWTPAQWGAGGVRSVAFTYDANGDATGLYHYAVEVTASYANTPSSTWVMRGQHAVVNRRHTSFGSGWWLAGLEQVVRTANGGWLWVGGDGSTRVYEPVADRTNLWVARTPDRGQDTLWGIANYPGEAYRRNVPGGATVHFDVHGRQIATVNRLDHHTHFEYFGTRLGRVYVPTAAGYYAFKPAYLFEYDGTAGVLRRVNAPDVNGTLSRAVQVHPHAASAAYVGAMVDPDGKGITFGYDQAGHIASRWDRMGALVSYEYGTEGKLREALHHMGGYQAYLYNGQKEVRSRFTPAEVQGLGGTPADPAQVHTLLDGPRTDVNDHTRFWLDRFGAPWRIVDAGNRETVLTRSDLRFPALVTRSDGPVQESGQRRTMSASYNGRGNVETQTDWSTSRMVDGVLVHATTQYAYEKTAGPAFLRDLVTRITAPEGEVTRMDYHANGNRAWQQPGEDAARRVHFGYHPATDPVAGGLVAWVQSAASQGRREQPERYTYDARGNLSSSYSPSGIPSHSHRDAFGRDTLVQTAISGPTNGQYGFSRQRAIYNAAGLVERTETEANGQHLSVAHTYDFEGRVLTTTRTMTPDTNRIGPMTLRWEYDALGRQIAEEDAELRKTRTDYNPAGQAVAVHSRRGLTTQMTYDVMGRMTQRVTPEVTYRRSVTTQFEHTWTFPRYRIDMDAAADTVIAVDTARFVYDTTGNLRQADNRYSQIRRGYALNGALTGDTLRIRTYTGQDFTSHSYALHHRYDLNGRRVRTQYPTQFASPTRGVAGDSVTYSYHEQTGALRQVTDLMGDAFTFSHNDEGQLTTRTLPGNLLESASYDVDGRLKRRDLFGNNPTFNGGTIVFSTYDYDARGKIRYGNSGAAYGVSEFDGMGALVSYSPGGAAHTYLMDPLGNPLSEIEPLEAEGGLQLRYIKHDYASRSGRLLSTNTYPNITNGAPVVERGFGYDVAGNQTSSRTSSGLGNDRTMQERVRLYYGADEKLRAVDRQRCMTILIYQGTTRRAVCGSWDETKKQDPGSFEEYRYDALGRRIWVRNQPESTQCGGIGVYLVACKANVVRYVWDGDQIVGEIRAEDGNRESDAASGDHAGQVLYTHGPGIDAPLSVLRLGLKDRTWSVIPHADWRGMYAAGTHRDGSINRCQDGVCLNLDTEMSWPSGSVGAFFNETQSVLPRKWMGSLIVNQKDASGQLYRRNRYYDPGTGRFTQEDPIGLAGGLNLYGFGGGDPVSYSDPYGLCVPQKDKDGKPIQTECERFAAFVDRMAGRAQTDEQFVRILGRWVAGFEGGNAELKPGPSPLKFGDSGFRAEYLDGDGHAPRHFTANFVVAFQRSEMLSRIAAWGREKVCNRGCSDEDIQLGYKGAELGGLLKSGELRRTDVGDWIRREM